MEGDGKAVVRPWWLKGQRKEQKGLLLWYTMGENLIELFEVKSLNLLGPLNTPWNFLLWFFVRPTLSLPDFTCVRIQCF